MRVREKEKKSGGQAARLTGTVREIRSELRKVVWPTRQGAINLTAIVIGVSLAVGVFLGMVDFVFSSMFQIILTPR